MWPASDVSGRYGCSCALWRRHLKRRCQLFGQPTRGCICIFVSLCLRANGNRNEALAKLFLFLCRAREGQLESCACVCYVMCQQVFVSHRYTSVHRNVLNFAVFAINVACTPLDRVGCACVRGYLCAAACACVCARCDFDWFSKSCARLRDAPFL